VSNDGFTDLEPNMPEVEIKPETEAKPEKPVRGQKNLSAEEAALVTAYMVHEYEKTKGKPVTRFRISRDSVRKNGQQENLREVFVDKWKEALAGEYGWVAFEVGEEFALIRKPLLKGWVRLGAKRILQTRQELRAGDRTALDTMRAELAAAAPAAEEKEAA
jgi:hypothetical protein